MKLVFSALVFMMKLPPAARQMSFCVQNPKQLDNHIMRHLGSSHL